MLNKLINFLLPTLNERRRRMVTKRSSTTNYSILKRRDTFRRNCRFIGVQLTYESNNR